MSIIINNRIKKGFLSVFFVLALAFAIFSIYTFKSEVDPFRLILSWNSLIVAGSIFLSYLISTFVWVSVIGVFGFPRSFGQAFVDVGFLTVGKYFPGKVLGLFARGAAISRSKEDRRIYVLSFLDQINSLLVGILFVFFLNLFVFIYSSPKLIFFLVFIFIFISSLGVKLSYFFVDRFL